MTGDIPTGQVPPQQPADAPPIYLQRPKRVVEFGIPMLLATIIVVLLLGFAGGVAARALFPAQRGPIGAQGKQGAAGETGPQGPAGNAQNINFQTIGYCFGYDTYAFSGGTTPDFITSIELYAPTVTNGTQSCPTGTFTPLQQSSNTPA